MNEEMKEKLQLTKELIAKLNDYFTLANSGIMNLVGDIDIESKRKELIVNAEGCNNSIINTMYQLVKETHDELLKRRILKWLKEYERDLEIIVGSMRVKGGKKVIYGGGRQRYEVDERELAELDRVRSQEDVETFREIVLSYGQTLQDAKLKFIEISREYRK